MMTITDRKLSEVRMTLVLMLVSITLSILSNQVYAGMCLPPPAQGAWENRDSGTQGITKLNFRMECRDVSTTTCSENTCSVTITAVEPHYFIHLWGSCHPMDCDWGEREGVSLTGSLDGWYHFYYENGSAKRFIYARTHPDDPDRLHLYIWTDFVDPDRADYASDDWYVRR